MSESRNFLTEGTFSLLKNFPVPNVFVIDGHARVSLKEFEHVLENGAVGLITDSKAGHFIFVWFVRFIDSIL